MTVSLKICWDKSRYLLIALSIIMIFSGNCLSADETTKFPEKLTFGILPEQNIFTQLERYEQLTNYLSDQLGIEIDLKILARYQSIIDNFHALELDGAFFGSFTYALAHSNIDLEMLARPINLDGTSTYHGLILTRKDNGIKSVNDMKHKRFAFVDKATTAGYLFPMAIFIKNDIDDYQTYFKETYFTGTHEDVIMDIIDGKADAGAAKNTVFERLATKNPLILDKLTILYSSPKVPSNGLAVTKKLPADLRKKIKDILLQMKDNSTGKQVLQKFKSLGFIETSEKEYQPVYDYARQIDLDLSTYKYINN